MLRAYERGRKPDSPVSVALVEAGSPLPPGPLPPMTSQTNDEGELTVTFEGRTGGSWTCLLVPWRDQTPDDLPTDLVPDAMNYLALRVLPADRRIARLPPTWDNVYQYVLRDWEAMAPCMDNWLLLGDRRQCRRYAGLIRQLTDPKRFDDVGYMPVTRDLTIGQRTLLHNWCKTATGAPSATGAEPAALAAEEPVAAPDKEPFGRGF